MTDPLVPDIQPGMIRSRTWRGQVEPSDTIKEFVRDYPYDHYVHLAAFVKDKIEHHLKTLTDANGQGVQARVTDRGKSRDSLLEKLKMRNDKREAETGQGYANRDEIWADIHDLAGVRIILYTATADDYQQIENMIFKIWGDNVIAVSKDKSNATPSCNCVSPQKKSTQDGETQSATSSERSISKRMEYIPKHDGYQAHHYRIRLTEHEGTTTRGLYSWMERDRVEIQVVSAFTHAWAEVEHNVQYKQYAYGRPTDQEKRLLDTLSGLVTTGDLLLEQFRDIFDKRTYKRFLDRDDFGTYFRGLDILDVEQLGEEKNRLRIEKEFGRVGLDIIFDLLVRLQLNYPLAVRTALKTLDYPENYATKLKMVINEFEPPFSPPQNLLAPLCLIHHLLIENKKKATNGEMKRPEENYNPMRQCSTMVNALLLLQTFAETPDGAKKFLQKAIGPSPPELWDSINFLLSDFRRHSCFDLEENDDLDDNIRADLAPAWAWFEEQAAKSEHTYSMCGLMFTLAKLGITKETDPKVLLRELVIGPLSRNNAGIWGMLSSDEYLE